MDSIALCNMTSYCSEFGKLFALIYFWMISEDYLFWALDSEAQYCVLLITWLEFGIIQCNIRVLGGLVSAHLLASDSSKKLLQGSYKNELLGLAEDLGKRFLPAFNTPTGLPYAWINLKVLYKTLKCPRFCKLFI